MPRPFLIDTDTASDDAVALIMALRRPDVEVVAVTVVAGNVPLEQAVRNALVTIERCGADVPVFPGAARPLQRDPAPADWYHGPDGMGGQNHAPPRAAPRTRDAVDTILEISRERAGLTLVTLGPLTNVALALRRDASLARRVDRCVVMGGNPGGVGNVTPAAEYNFWCDPEAADVVLRSGLPIELAGWHLSCGRAVLSADEIKRVGDLGTPLARFAIDCNATAIEANMTQTGVEGLALADPTAMAVALDPRIVTDARDHRVAVACADELTRGQSIVDSLGVADDPRNHATWIGAGRCRVIWSIDTAQWKRMLFDALR